MQKYEILRTVRREVPSPSGAVVSVSFETVGFIHADSPEAAFKLAKPSYPHYEIAITSLEPDHAHTTH